jgi:hypothetical protein
MSVANIVIITVGPVCAVMSLFELYSRISPASSRINAYRVRTQNNFSSAANNRLHLVLIEQ